MVHGELFGVLFVVGMIMFAATAIIGIAVACKRDDPDGTFLRFLPMFGFKLGLWLLALVVVSSIGLAGGCGTYAEGTRSGTLVKVSDKSFLWRSYEAELRLSEADKGWHASTRDPAMYETLNALVGKRVKLTYRQWVIAPVQQSTAYTITDVQEVASNGK